MRLFKKRHIWLPTWPVLLLFLGGFFLLGGILFFASHDFLAVSKPAPGAKVLVAESWMTDTSLEMVAELMNADGSQYDAIWLTGTKLDQGSHLYQRFQNANALAAATLAALGVAEDKIHTATPADTQRHRTHAAASAFKDDLAQSGATPTSFDLVTLDVHARRSRLVYKKVFPDAEVGIIALPPEGYDADGWYRTSAGTKNTIFEIMAYVYEKLGDGGR